MGSRKMNRFLAFLVLGLCSANYGDSDRFWQKRNWAFADLMTPDGSFNFDAKRGYFSSQPFIQPNDAMVETMQEPIKFKSPKQWPVSYQLQSSNRHYCRTTQNKETVT